MFRLLKKLRHAKASKARAVALQACANACAEAETAYRKAVIDRDTRDQHHAHKRLVEAQSARLRVELGR